MSSEQANAVVIIDEVPDIEDLVTGRHERGGGKSELFWRTNNEQFYTYFDIIDHTVFVLHKMSGWSDLK